jgi:hypothetical protein
VHDGEPWLLAYEPVMTANHRSVIGDITHGSYQCREAGDLTRTSYEKRKWHQVARSVHFRRQHQGAAQAHRLSQGLPGDVSHQGVGGEAERRITHQLSGKALKQYYDGE